MKYPNPQRLSSSDEVEGPAFAGACCSSPVSAVAGSCCYAERSGVPPQRKRHHNLSNLLATALAFILFSATSTQAQLPAGTIDTTAPQSNAAPNAALLTQADEALQKNDFITAEKLLTSLTHDNPKDPHLLFDLGLTEDNLDHTAAAEAAYRAASAADPRFVDAHLALGLLLARANKTTDARTELLAAANIPIDAKDPAPTGRALRALARLDLPTNPADARDELIYALELTPETPGDILLSAQIAEALADLPLAESAYTRYLALKPNGDKADPDATAALAHVLVRDNRPGEAENLLTQALAVHPGDTALTAHLASAYIADSDPARSALAVPLVEALHAQHPEESSITRLLARLYAQTKQPEKADPLYADLLKQTPNDVTLIDDYAANLIRLGRPAPAETLLKQAIATPAAFPTPDDLASAYNYLAYSASENNDPTMALQALDLRAKVAPITAGSVFLAATAHDKLHQYKQASELYKQFLDMPEVKADSKFADQEWEAKHRLIALEHMK